MLILQSTAGLYIRCNPFNLLLMGIHAKPWRCFLDFVAGAFLTNFVLQESPDLSGWSAVTNTPVLNLNNLQNEVTLSSTNIARFYRLKTP